MKNKTILFLRYLLILVFVFLSFWTFFHPKKTETNILKAIVADSANDRVIVELSKKYSSDFNVTIEANDFESARIAADKFESMLDKKVFAGKDLSFSNAGSILEVYKKYYGNLLSNNTANEIRNGKYKDVSKQAMHRLYQPLGINIIPLEDDPFLLFDDYLSSLSGVNLSGEGEYGGKYYVFSSYKVKDEISLSPVLLNDEISKLIKVKDEIKKEYKDIEIYLTGTPIHTFYASSKSMAEINVICVLSLLFIVFIAKFYFREYKILLPVALSLGFGTLTGYYLCSLFFDSIHVLTFVFSTTLIGICVDYSLHFFANGTDLNKIFKSLTISMLTTVIAFLILLLSKIELLMQIALFTSGGLMSVYMFVCLFHPLIAKKMKLKSFDTFDIDKLNVIKLSKNARKVIVVLALIISTAGVLKINFDDDISNMYKPSDGLMKAEKIYSKVSGGNITTVFIPVVGDNIQEILENEEKITKSLNDNEFYSLSKFVPSINKQKENIALRNLLYKNELKNYAVFLKSCYIDKLLEGKNNNEFLTADELSKIKEGFLIDDKTSVIVLKNADLKKVKNANIIDLKNDISRYVKLCRENCLKLLIPVIFILYIGLSFAYGFKGAYKTALPSILGGFFSIGILGLFNQDINLFHTLSLFLIAGFSLDYSIFRYSSKDKSKETRGAVLISCATSVFSFLLLSLTSFKLISSLGFILAFGLTSAYIFSILLIDNDDGTNKQRMV